jgi:hypothetical protein
MKQDMEKLIYRYRTDHKFATAVKILHRFMVGNSYTPKDLLEMVAVVDMRQQEFDRYYPRGTEFDIAYLDEARDIAEESYKKIQEIIDKSDFLKSIDPQILGKFKNE